MEAQQEFILQPTTIKHILILSPGKWNDVDYTELEIQKAFHNTDWSDKKYSSLYLDHQDTKERGVGNWVGFIKNPSLENSAVYGDLEIWNPMIGAYLSQAKAKFGLSATLAGRENKQLNQMEDFHFESTSIVTDPACKPAMINLADKSVNMVQNSDIKVVTMENEISEDLIELESVKHEKRREDIESVGDKKDFCSALKAALVDEKKAPSDYENLKSLTDDKEVKKIIDEIIEDEKKHFSLLEGIEAKKELANEGSPMEAHALEPVKYEKKKEELDKIVPDTVHDTYVDGHSIWIKQEGKKLSQEELGAKFERQVSHIKDSLKKTHPDWSEEKIKEVAYATANKMKESLSELNQAWGGSMDESPGISTKIMENSDNIELKGGKKMPENMENESVKMEELAKPEPMEDEKSKADKAEDKKESKDKEKSKSDDKKDEDKEEMSSEAILNKIKEMSAEELVSYTNFVKSYLSENNSASAKEVTLAFEKSKEKKEKEKELSASDLLVAMDSRIASLKELDSSKKMQEMEVKIQELSAKVKTPDRKTLSVAFDTAQDSNLGMLNFLQHRIN